MPITDLKQVDHIEPEIYSGPLGDDNAPNSNLNVSVYDSALSGDSDDNDDNNNDVLNDVNTHSQSESDAAIPEETIHFQETIHSPVALRRSARQNRGAPPNRYASSVDGISEELKGKVYLSTNHRKDPRKEQ